MKSVAIIRRMAKQKDNSVVRPLCGADLELWRIENGLTKSEASDAFGLQKAKWEELIGPGRAKEALSDPAVAMLLHLYRLHPESAPMATPPDVGQFYSFLGLTDQPQDRETFAVLIGRSPPSVYRLLLHNGKPGRPVVRWIEAIYRLRLTPKQSKMLMADVVGEVSGRQGVPDVGRAGWSRHGAAANDAE